MILTQEILDALKQDIGSITNSNGYYTDLILCHDTLKELKDVKLDEFDSFYVYSGLAKATHEESCIVWDWGIAIYFYLRVPNEVVDSGLISEKIEKLKADIRTLFTTVLEVNAVEGVVSTEILYEEPYIDNKNDKAIFLLLLNINFIN